MHASPANPSAPMSPDAVVALLTALTEAAVAVSIGGGWGVDALLGRQTREHMDIDLALASADCDRAAAALAALGYEHDADTWPGLPARFVLKNDEGRQVDLHPLVFDREGNGWLQLAEGGWYLHPARFLRWDGTIADQPVHCIAPELQLSFHLGYEWRAEDRHDLALLARAFGIPLPPDFTAATD